MQGRNCEDWGLICGELGLGATVHAVQQYPQVLFMPKVVAAARVGGAQGTPAAGLRPRPAREKGSPSNLLLALIDTSPHLIKRGFLDPKVRTRSYPKSNPNCLAEPAY
jgi:hypothetical protein